MPVRIVLRKWKRWSIITGFFSYIEKLDTLEFVYIDNIEKEYFIEDVKKTMKILVVVNSLYSSSNWSRRIKSYSLIIVRHPSGLPTFNDGQWTPLDGVGT